MSASKAPYNRVRDSTRAGLSDATPRPGLNSDHCLAEAARVLAQSLDYTATVVSVVDVTLLPVPSEGDELRLNSKDAGFAAHLVKPADIQSLLRTIEATTSPTRVP
ncbi:MAG: hypothetical protein ABIQ16_19365 [Polyangiaceae bacterium]